MTPTCDVCGKSLEVLGTTLPGLQVRISGDPFDPEKTKAFAEAVFPYCLNKTYRICFPCGLRRLGVKP